MGGNGLNIFRGFRRCDWFHAHGKESTEKQNGCAPNLSVSEAFAINPCGKPHCARRTKELESLGQRDADLSYCYIVQNMCEGDAAYCRDYQDQINVRSRVKRSANISKRERERKQQD